MQLWEKVLMAFGGVSGVALLIWGAVKWVSKQMAEGLQKKYDEKLKEKFEAYKAEIDKELETHKAALGSKNYITQKKFDAEFAMYQALAEKYYKLVNAASRLIPNGFVYEPVDKDKKKKLDEEHYKVLVTAINETQELIYKYGPFIQEPVFKGYEDILRRCQGHKMVFENRWNVGDLRSQEEKESFSAADYKRTGEIISIYEDVNHKLREYLQSLEIL